MAPLFQETRLRKKTMCTDRRNFLRLSAAAVTGAGLAVNSFAESTFTEAFQQREIPDPIRRLKRMTEGVVPISLDERRGRIEKARRLMRQNRIDAIYIESGASMFYYTGVRWGLSERMFALVIPQRGEIAWICPKFEEAKSARADSVGNDIRTWEEDASPFKLVADILRDRGVRTGRVGMEERVRFFLFDGIRKAAPGLQFVSATQ